MAGRRAPARGACSQAPLKAACQLELQRRPVGAMQSCGERVHAAWAALCRAPLASPFGRMALRRPPGSLVVRAAAAVPVLSRPGGLPFAQARAAAPRTRNAAGADARRWAATLTLPWRRPATRTAGTRRSATWTRAGRGGTCRLRARPARSSTCRPRRWSASARACPRCCWATARAAPSARWPSGRAGARRASWARPPRGSCRRAGGGCRLRGVQLLAPPSYPAVCPASSVAVLCCG